jgi:two-component system, NtrC family, nitrogen regulation sensor histidine kinase NtrY
MRIRSVSLRWRFTIYLLVLHVLLAGLAIVLLQQNRMWLFAIEAVFAITLTVGLSLTRNIFRSFALWREGSQLLREHEFTSRFRDVGQPEIDALIAVYNQMADHLRDERTRLQEQHYFLSRILQVSPLGIITLDFDDRVTLTNPSAERLLGLPADRIDGRRLTELASPLMEALVALRPGDSRVVPVQGARRVKCHRGTFLDRGFPRTFLLLEELTEELRQYEKAAYEKLIRVMSHEVNNTIGASNSLLHSVLTYASELTPDNRKDFESAIGIVIGRTEQLNGFMRSFADVVRLPPPNRSRHELRPILENLVRLLTPATTRWAIQWKWDVRAEPIVAAIDRGQIEQAFVNILKNAMEAIGHDGTITIRLLPHASTSGGANAAGKGAGAVIIEDTGPGIPEEARANLFTPFFSTKETGQGIGLTLVQEILTQHQCEYSLESPPGGPTQFTIVFPS